MFKVSPGFSLTYRNVLEILLNNSFIIFQFFVDFSFFEDQYVLEDARTKFDTPFQFCFLFYF